MSDPRINAFWQRQGDTPTSDEVVAEVDHEAIYCDADNPLGGPSCGRLVTHDGTQPVPHDGLHEAVGADGALYRWGTRQRTLTPAALLERHRAELLHSLAAGADLASYTISDGVVREAATGRPVGTTSGGGDYVVDADGDGRLRGPAKFRAELTAEEVRRVLHRYAVQNGADEANAMGISTQLEYLARSGAVNARDGIARYDTYKLIHRDRDVWPWWRRVLATVAAHPDGPTLDGVEVVYDDVLRFVERVLTEHAADRVEDPPSFTRGEVVACLARWAEQQGASEVWADEIAERFTHLIAGAAAHPDRRGTDLGTIIYDALEYHLGHGQLSEQVDGALWLLGSAGRLLQRGATHRWGGGGGPEGQTSLIPAAPTTVPPGSPYVIVTTREGHLP